MARIKRADVEFLSLCKRGRNKLKTIYKADDDSVEFQAHVLKADDFEERGELLAVVYAPNMADKDGDFADAEAIQDMAHGYLRKGAKIDTYHDEQALSEDQVYVAESFVIQKGDPRFEGQVTYDDEPVDVTGGWGVLIKVDDPEIRKAYGKDGWQGISLGGNALMADEELTPAKKASVAKSLANKKENAMTPEEIAKAVADANKPLIDSISTLTKALTPAEEPEKKEEEKVEKSDDFDKTDPKAVAKHLADLKKAELQKDVDWDDAESVAAYADKLAALEKADDKEDKKVEKADDEAPGESRQGDKVDAKADDEITWGGLVKADDVGSKATVKDMLAAIGQGED